MASKEERLARRVEQRLVQQTMQAFSGPLPPPSMLAEYNNVVQNGAERIMVMAEKQQTIGKKWNHDLYGRILPTSESD